MSSLYGGRMAVPIHRALGLTDDEADAIEQILGRLPNHLELAMFAVMWSEHCSYKSSRRHLSPAADRGAVGPRRPRRERRRGRRGRRHRRRHPHREPQPPVGHRAVPGCGDRRRRHPARHLHDGRPAHRPHGPVAIRSPRRRPKPLDRRRSRVGDRRLRQCRRRPDGRWRGRVRRDLSRQSARERAVPGRAPGRPPGAGAGQRRGQSGRAARLHDRARRHRWRERAGVGGVRGGRGRRGQAAERAGRRPVRGEAADRGVPGPPRRRPRGRHPGPGGRRPHLRHQRDGQPGPAWAWTSTCSPCPGARRAWSRSRS